MEAKNATDYAGGRASVASVGLVLVDGLKKLIYYETNRKLYLDVCGPLLLELQLSRPKGLCGIPYPGESCYLVI